MKFCAFLLSTALLATTTASPSPALQRRLDRRAEMNVRATENSLDNAEYSDNSNSKVNAVARDDATVAYSNNWSGAVITPQNAGETFNQVSATVTVTKPTVPSGVDAPYGTYGTAVWVGIDGWEYKYAILQTGIDMIVDATGKASYNAWYEWFPDVMYNFNNFTITEGDVVNMYVNASTNTSGTATVENLTSGISATVTLNTGKEGAILGQNAEWIVEDFAQQQHLIAFADFGNVTFTNCVAKTSSGTTQDLSGAEILKITSTDETEVLTDVSLVSDSVLNLVYSPEPRN